MPAAPQTTCRRVAVARDCPWACGAPRRARAASRDARAAVHHPRPHPTANRRRPRRATPLHRAENSPDRKKGIYDKAEA
eukprot:2478285-Prymnesium_polylepis.2